jgi:glycogen phosphorylase
MNMPIQPIEAKRLDFNELVDFHLKYSLGIRVKQATVQDLFGALALATRNYLIDRIFATEDILHKSKAKKMYYLSLEFLIGRLLSSNLQNLGIEEQARTLLEKFNLTLEDIEEVEADAALGNGGLGRLAACFLDSLATLNMPGFGYGINYEYGLFKQRIEKGHQKEIPDHWLHEDAPWLLERHYEPYQIPLYGKIDHTGEKGKFGYWKDYKIIIGVPFDIPVAGFGGKTVNYLRLFSARSSNEFDIQIFNGGDYIHAVEEKIYSEKISKVLYPSDSCWGGKELRLIQEYFLVACSLRDIIQEHIKIYSTLENLPEKIALQLNDTHPALAIAELMRILIDEHDFLWERAWEITQACCGYTNHTLLPEALEKWHVNMFEYVLPRHLEIIYDINHHFLNEIRRRWSNDGDFIRRLSLIEENGEKQIRMAHLAIVGSHSVNGVAELHSELVKTRLVPDFNALYPERFNNKTNGVTPRRWLLQSNPSLSTLLKETIGTGWITNLEQLKTLEQYAEDNSFHDRFNNSKRINKERLAYIIKNHVGVNVDTSSMFDVQIKRIHEYKRQLLNILRVIHDYLSIVEDHKTLIAPRTCIFGGKAAPGYIMAKSIIKLINNVAEIVNNDPIVSEQLKVVFIPDYRVSLAEKIIPAANLSEQISTAGTEASGTGNMKFAMNGALTIGTLDGANIEIREEVGKDNIYIFGLKTREVEEMRRSHTYHPWDYYHRNPTIKRIMDSLVTNRFSPTEPGIFQIIFDNLLNGGDYFFHLADLESYISVQQKVSEDFMKTQKWTKKAILNVARMGKFSSDRTIREYAEDIWKIEPLY